MHAPAIGRGIGRAALFGARPRGRGPQPRSAVRRPEGTWQACRPNPNRVAWRRRLLPEHVRKGGTPERRPAVGGMLTSMALTTFLTDLLKSLGLAVVLGVPLLAGVMAFLAYAGPYAWVYCWLAMTVFTLGLQWLAPTWIMPLFNTFTPLEPGALKDAILAYARTVNFAVEDVFVIDGSRRSSKSNAFFTGFGKHKRIALFDTLIASHTVPELVAVLAHECGPWGQ